jgi:hypothetical protein
VKSQKGNESMTHCLEGKSITAIEIANDKKAVRFLIEGDNPVVAKADGDCCSNSWIEHVELPAMGFPVKVISVKDIDLPGSCDDSEEYECLTVYGCKIVTDKGDIIIDYRNSSNGYYGGDLVWPDNDYFYGGVYGQNVSNEDWEPLEESL